MQDVYNDGYSNKGDTITTVIDVYEEGVFYHAYDSDARLLAEVTGYKLVRTKWHGKVRPRCGFPIEASEKAAALLKKHGIACRIHSSDSGVDDFFENITGTVPEPAAAYADAGIEMGVTGPTAMAGTLTLGLVE